MSTSGDAEQTLRVVSPSHARWARCNADDDDDEGPNRSRRPNAIVRKRAYILELYYHIYSVRVKEKALGTI